MTQIAIVTAAPRDGAAQVEVRRQSACGHDCEHCAGCGAAVQSAIRVEARTELPLEVGDRVEIFSDNRVLGFAALVYLAPVALFLLGFLLPSGLSEGGRCLCGGAGFLLGLLLAIACDRRLRRGSGAVTYRVTRKL